MKRAKRTVLWFRQDLRLHDNEALCKALERGEEIVPVYVFDQRKLLDKTTYGFRKTGKFRTKFLLEAVQDLKNSFQEKGIDLVVREGKPEEEIPRLTKEVGARWVFANMERTPNEVEVQNNLEKKLWGIGHEIRFFRGKMLYYTQDLPFPIAHSPDLFSVFRKEVERYTSIRDPLHSPRNFKAWTHPIEVGAIPHLSDFGYKDFETDGRGVLDFKGGETVALDRLKYYLWETNLMASYEKNRDGLIAAEASSKLSPWLALGCISPKWIYSELKSFEKLRTKNKSTYAFFVQLLWRDFFRLMGKKYKHCIFEKAGIKGKEVKRLSDNWAHFNCWANAQTGIPFIDACMTELNQTGYLSNRGRQNVASYLINDLNVNWQMGAEYFESKLLDYDICSNWVNWSQIAGASEDRYFHPVNQAKRYDPQGNYIKRWLPHLRDVPENEIHKISSHESPKEGMRS